MEKYVPLKQIGSGTFGRVWKAVNKQSGEVVAVKVLKKMNFSMDECLNLREVECLRKIKHPNIVRLKEISKQNNIVHFVFEYMECNLYELIENRKQQRFSEDEVRKLCFQVLQGLNYMHQQGYFHRDLKPENLLVSQDTVKIADLGLARRIDSGPPYTEYVATRWYRAPELLLQSGMYSEKVDMWAMGAIMAELFTLRPLFPGSSEADEMYKICSVIGTPTMDSWPAGLRQASAVNYIFPQLPGIDISALMPSASEDAISLIRSLCSWDPCRRPTASEALKHPFFQDCFYVPPHLRARAAVATTTQSAAARGMLDQQGAGMYSSALSNSKLVSDLPSADLSADVQCMSVRQPKYYPAAGRRNPVTIVEGRTAHGIPDLAEHLANMTIASHGQFVEQPQLPPMKTGLPYNAEAGDLFLRAVQHLEPNRVYDRKVG